MESGCPFAGEIMLYLDSINHLVSAWAFAESGTCTAIWSPSKSALNGGHTKGCSLMAFPSTSFGINACMDILWSVGALLSMTGWSLITSSRTSHAWGISFSMMAFFSFFALLDVLSLPSNLDSTKGLNNSRAIFFGIPHSCIFKSGPTTITARPE